MKQGKLIRRAVSAALAGCMMFTLSAPALAESTDALMQLNISGNRAVSVLDAENVAEEIKINNNVIDPADYENIVVTPGNYTFHYDPVQKILNLPILLRRLILLPLRCRMMLTWCWMARKTLQSTT